MGCFFYEEANRMRVSALILLLVLPLYAVSFAAPMPQKTFPVTADIETTPVHNAGDAADDPAIWVHPTDVTQSRILGSDKQEGIDVCDLNGKRTVSYPFGEMNNIDVRYDFPLRGHSVDIVGGSNRTSWEISLYTIEEGRLRNVNGTPIKPKMPKMYGFSFYHSQRTDKYYALIAGKGGEFEQYELFDNGQGKIDGKLVRSMKFASVTEGIVADDEYGKIYVAEERGSVWKFNAEPGDNTLTKIGTAGDGKLTADIEGLAIYYTADGEGYLIISSQGNSTYAVYERTGDNKYINSFEINKGALDGTFDTDGIDVMSFGLGDKWPNGFFVAQDGSNTDKRFPFFFNQNFKVVSWEKIAKALNLKIDNTVNPRQLKQRQ
jgi:3-phytase